MQVSVLTDGKGGFQMFVHACAAFVIAGEATAETGENVAVVYLTYDMPDFAAVEAIVKAMKRAEVVPEVHVWDTHLDEPEVAVMFRLKDPAMSVIGEITPGLGEVFSLAGVACSQVLTTGEANIPRRSIELFLERFRQYGFALVVVTQKKNHADHLPHTDERFIVDSVSLVEPRYALPNQ